MVLIGGSKVTQFSYLEYQLLMLSLAGTICTAIGTVEIALRRFQVLPLLFPGMFIVRERRFYFFNFDISDGSLGKRIRAEAKMLIRITLCVVLSYLWQHCVLETTQQVGTEFPRKQCEENHDCFASELHFFTLFNRQHEAIDCNKKDEDLDQVFPRRVVVSCIRFITPSAETWLMHLAIANSVMQLNFKAFEVLVWMCGNSPMTRHFIGALILLTLSVFVGLFFGGVMSEFVSSWLSFVMSLAIPAFLHTTWKCAKALDELWRMDAVQVQQNIEKHLNDAFAEIEHGIALESDGVLMKADKNGNGGGAVKNQTVNRRSNRALSTFSRVVKGFPTRFGTLIKKNRGRRQRKENCDADGPEEEYESDPQTSASMSPSSAKAIAPSNGTEANGTETAREDPSREKRPLQAAQQPDFL
mmetsp:Transcript_17641/g.32482  ORF Transcript_17641/g.32482 Transcript_17641/m.32482 type:complete len:414 (-) Transcript_17641:94-1335(-)